MIKKHMVVDMNRMHAFFGDNTLAIHHFLYFFVISAKTQLEKINTAATKKQIESAHFGLHKLKSSASNSGFSKMNKLCENAEKKVIQSDWIAVKCLCKQIEKNIQKIQDELPDEFKNS